MWASETPTRSVKILSVIPNCWGSQGAPYKTKSNQNIETSLKVIVMASKRSSGGSRGHSCVVVKIMKLTLVAVFIPPTNEVVDR